MDNNRELWCRIGAVLALTPEEEAVIFGSDPDAIAQTVKNVFAEGRFRLEGNSYVPAPCVEDFNEEYGTEYPEKDIDYWL